MEGITRYIIFSEIYIVQFYIEQFHLGMYYRIKTTPLQNLYLGGMVPLAASSNRCSLQYIARAYEMAIITYYAKS